MRRALLATVVAAVAAGGLLLVTAASGSREATGSLTQPRVCGPDAFSSGGARCIVHEAAGLRANTLHCSARAKNLAGERYTGVFSFKGQRFPAQTGVVPGDGWIYTTLQLPGGTFPAGRWSCAIGAGEAVARASFTTAGATGTLTSAAACPTARTVSERGVRACPTDLGARPFAATSTVTCSALYSLAAGRTASATLLYRGRSTGLALRRTLSNPVSVLGMQVQRRGGLPSGAYTCVFSLDGKRLGTRGFEIATVPASAAR